MRRLLWTAAQSLGRFHLLWKCSVLSQCQACLFTGCAPSKAFPVPGSCWGAGSSGRDREAGWLGCLWQGQLQGLGKSHFCASLFLLTVGLWAMNVSRHMDSYLLRGRQALRSNFGTSPHQLVLGKQWSLLGHLHLHPRAQPRIYGGWFSFFVCPNPELNLARAAGENQRRMAGV